MKKSILITLVAFATSLTFGQGTLTPPGAPAPTMKTLDQLDASIGAVSNTVGQIKGDPRTPISSVPYTISEPGSYYLTTNLTSTGHGVVITTNGVTLDLMGFTLSGDGGYDDYGVFVDGATNRVIERVVVRNGAVKNFSDGIEVEYSLGGRFKKLEIFDNTYFGIYFNGQDGQCDGNTIAECSISGNDSLGIYFNGQGGGQCEGNTIVDCTIGGNSDFGIYLNGYGGQCDGNRVADCSISENDSYGVDFSGYGGQCIGNTMADCTISGNGNLGVYLDGSSGQCDNNTMANCTISGNDDYGVYLDGQDGGQCDGNTVADCTISGNSSYGIYLNGQNGQCYGNRVADCTIGKNGERGISMLYADGNRVEDNHVTGQIGDPTYGIYCLFTARNIVIRNSCVGQTNNLVFNSNDTTGPTVTSSGVMMPTNGAATLSPWANFSR